MWFLPYRGDSVLELIGEYRTGYDTTENYPSQHPVLNTTQIYSQVSPLSQSLSTPIANNYCETVPTDYLDFGLGRV